MARPKRLDYPGAWHHVMNRGGRHAPADVSPPPARPIFQLEVDCYRFLEAVGDTAQRFDLEVHAYSLMPNHFHLLVRSPHATLSRAMRHLGATYTQAINATYGWDGALFRGRFRSRLVTDDTYLRQLFAYLHLNPVAAHLVKRPDEQPSWTSHRAHLGLEAAPPWLRLDEVTRLFGSPRQLDDFIRSIHQRETPWPEDFRASVDLFAPRRRSASPDAPPEVHLASAPRPDLDALLERVAQATATPLPDLKSTHRGRGANRPRRFAATVLGRLPTVQAKDISQLLDMPVQQVRMLRWRGTSPADAAVFATWDDELSRLDNPRRDARATTSKRARPEGA